MAYIEKDPKESRDHAGKYAVVNTDRHRPYRRLHMSYHLWMCPVAPTGHNYIGHNHTGAITIQATTVQAITL